MKSEQTKVISDLKLGFRHEQIENEGNDPVKTGQSFGTAHDIASMNQKQDDEGGSPEGGFDGAGRPPKSGNYKTDDNPFGRDPLGQKTDIKPASTYHKYKNSPLAYESAEALKTSLKNVKVKSPSILKESLSEEKQKESGLLDERNLLEDTI